MTEITKWQAIVREIGPGFAERIAENDAQDKFVADNYVVMKQRGLFTAGVPAELGGGGATHPELCTMIRELAHHCSSTALALSMHTHLVAGLAYMWRAGNKAPEGMLKRVAAENLVLVSTGGSDWLAGSGKLTKVDGGFRFSGRKIFGSGGPAGDVLMTTGVYDDPKDGPTVIHFPVSMRAEGVKILDTWRVLGMRATGSHDIELDSVFLPDAVMGGVHRAAGKWHPFMHTILLVVCPIFYGAYVGTAEAARDVAIGMAGKKREDPHVAYLVGELDQHLTQAQLALQSMVDLVATAKPGPETSGLVMLRRGLLVNGVIATVNKALEVAGGASFYRSGKLERLFRDAQGVRFHPVQEKPAARYVGRLRLGLDIDG
jgi:alkylation response protein AidB-like acyl-CoA dehydrogenase